MNNDNLFPLQNKLAENALSYMKESKLFFKGSNSDSILKVINDHHQILSSYEINTDKSLKVPIGRLHSICDPSLPSEMYKNSKPLLLKFD